MNYQLLLNFIQNRVRKNDVYIPSMILFLIKNDGWATKEQIARIIYIFEYKHSLEDYEIIVERFAYAIASDYGIVESEDDIFRLKTWPLSKHEIDSIEKQCYKISNGFFRNLKESEKV